MAYLNSPEPQKKIWKEDPGKDFIIDEILDEIYREREVLIISFLKEKHPRKTSGLTSEDIHDLIKFMISQDLIMPINSGNACIQYKFSPKGELIYSKDGWIKLKEREEFEKLKEAIKRDKISKFNNDFNNKIRFK